MTPCQGRSVEKLEAIISNDRDKETTLDLERLANAKIDGPSVTLAYMADDKSHVSRLPECQPSGFKPVSQKEPIEALLRSLLLVFMDNATAEYNFVTTFFPLDPLLPSQESDNSLFSPPLLSPVAATERRLSNTPSDYGGRRNRASSIVSTGGFASLSAAVKEEQASSDAIWKQIVEPVLEYTDVCIYLLLILCLAHILSQTFVRSVLDPIPPVVPMLTMIRLTEDVVAEIQKRGCPPAETFIFGIRLKLWPVFQKAMTEHIDALKKLADGSSTGYFSRASTTTDSVVSNVSFGLPCPFF